MRGYYLVLWAILGFVVVGLTIAAEPKPIVIEIESFTLTDAKVQELKGASGGKVVLFDSEKSKAIGKVKLPAGKYQLTLYCQAEDEERDATYLQVNKDLDNRLWPVEKGSIQPCEDIVFFAVAEEGEQTIALWTAETGVLLDRVEIIKVK
jgi:hypothetical protein